MPSAYQLYLALQRVSCFDAPGSSNAMALHRRLGKVEIE